MFLSNVPFGHELHSWRIVALRQLLPLHSHRLVDSLPSRSSSCLQTSLLVLLSTHFHGTGVERGCQRPVLLAAVAQHPSWNFAVSVEWHTLFERLFLMVERSFGNYPCVPPIGRCFLSLWLKMCLGWQFYLFASPLLMFIINSVPFFCISLLRPVFLQKHSRHQRWYGYPSSLHPQFPIACHKYGDLLGKSCRLSTNLQLLTYLYHTLGYGRSCLSYTSWGECCIYSVTSNRSCCFETTDGL